MTRSIDAGSDAEAASNAGTSISAMTTFMPSAPNRFTSASPIPLAAPVTTTTLPDNCSMTTPKNQWANNRDPSGTKMASDESDGISTGSDQT